MSKDKEKNPQSDNKDFDDQIYGEKIPGQKGTRRIINTGDGDYHKNIEGDYIQQSGTFGIRVNKGTISGVKIVAGVINEVETQKVAEVAAEIKQLLQQLKQDNLSNNTSAKMMLAAQVIQQIENNPTLKKKVISAVKEGGLAALEKAIDHPAGAFIFAAIRGWQEVEEE
jgi:hypothetical protein